MLIIEKNTWVTFLLTELSMFQGQESPSHTTDRLKNLAASSDQRSQEGMRFGNTDCSVLKDFATKKNAARITLINTSFSQLEVVLSRA